MTFKQKPIKENTNLQQQQQQQNCKYLCNEIFFFCKLVNFIR